MNDSIALTATAIANSARFVAMNHNRELHPNSSPKEFQRHASVYNAHCIFKAQKPGAVVPMSVINYLSNAGNIDPRWTLAELIAVSM